MSLAIAVAGVGFMGQDHVRRIQQGSGLAQVTKIFDLNEQNLTATLAIAPNAVVASSVAELLSDVDALLIATHADSHYELIQAALGAKIPVFVEKPLTRDSVSALRVVQLEQQHAQPAIQVGHMRRYHRPYLELKELIDREQHGLPLMLHFTHRLPRYRPGAHYNQTITDALVHEIDLASWLLGENIVETTVHRVRANRFQDVEGLVDPVFVVLRSASGVLVNVEINAGAGYGYEIRTEAVLERASITLDHGLHRYRISSEGFEGRPYPDTYLPVFKDAYDDQIDRWLRAVASGNNIDEHGATTWDGYRSTLVAEATVTALDNGHPVQIEYPSN